MAKYLIIIALILYSIWAIRKIYLKKKNGSCCGGSCGSCKCDCSSKSKSQNK